MQEAAEALSKLLYSLGICDERVLNAIATTPREQFLPSELQDIAYENEALPIACQQTISQPFIVASMTEAVLGGKKLIKVLEIGTGSGYQAAVLSKLVDEVYTIERIEDLYESATQLFKKLHYNNIHTRFGDGSLGWPEESPFDGIIVTAAASFIPETLKQQLVVGGRLVIPVGDTRSQILKVITRTEQGFETEDLEWVVFVPLLPGVR
jgi:protein-L-isoaspartate(D-aspartate) O-methyltransferase